METVNPSFNSANCLRNILFLSNIWLKLENWSICHEIWHNSLQMMSLAILVTSLNFHLMLTSGQNLCVVCPLSRSPGGEEVLWLGSFLFVDISSCSKSSQVHVLLICLQSIYNIVTLIFQIIIFLGEVSLLSWSSWACICAEWMQTDENPLRANLLEVKSSKCFNLSKIFSLILRLVSPTYE